MFRIVTSHKSSHIIHYLVKYNVNAIECQDKHSGFGNQAIISDFMDIDMFMH